MPAPVFPLCLHLNLLEKFYEGIRVGLSLGHVVCLQYTNDYHHSFFPRIVGQWNILPQEVTQLSTAESFSNTILFMQLVLGTPLHFTV